MLNSIIVISSVIVIIDNITIIYKVIHNKLLNIVDIICLIAFIPAIQNLIKVVN